jgi:hypothetical protein
MGSSRQRPSSLAANNVLPETQSRFRWQTSYGVLTVGVRHLPFVVRYIQQQKEHHDTNTDLQPYLERTTE